MKIFLLKLLTFLLALTTGIIHLFIVLHGQAYGWLYIPLAIGSLLLTIMFAALYTEPISSYEEPSYFDTEETYFCDVRFFRDRYAPKSDNLRLVGIRADGSEGYLKRFTCKKNIIHHSNRFDQILYSEKDDIENSFIGEFYITVTEIKEYLFVKQRGKSYEKLVYRLHVSRKDQEKFGIDPVPNSFSDLFALLPFSSKNPSV